MTCHVHDETCGYAEDEDGNEISPCTHLHDENCQNAEAVLGTPCTYVCDICSGTEAEKANTLAASPRATESGTTVSTWNDLNSAITSAPTNGTETIINIDGDVTPGSLITVEKDQNIVINGGSIKRDTLPQIFNVKGTLTLNDFKADGNSTTMNAGYGFICVQTDGSLIINSGCVFENMNISYERGTITIYENANCTINGGTFRNITFTGTSKFSCAGIYNTGTLTVNGGKFTGIISTGNAYGAAIYNVSTAKCYIYGGTFDSSNKANANEAGIFHSSQDEGNAEMHLSGAPTINCPLFLDAKESYKHIYLDGSLTGSVVLKPAKYMENYVLVMAASGYTLTDSDYLRINLLQNQTDTSAHWYTVLSDDGRSIVMTSDAAKAGKLDKVYVSPGGNDSNGGSSPADAVASVDRAKELAAIDGKIEIIDNVDVTDNELWELPDNVFGADSEITGDGNGTTITVKPGGNLDLGDITIKDIDEIVIEPGGNASLGNNTDITGSGTTITVKDGGTLNVGSDTDLTNVPAIEAGGGATINDNGNASVGGKVTEIKKTLTGTVTVTGTLKYGETLTATVTDTNNTGTLAYQWKRGGNNITGAENSTYTTTVDDIGGTLTCVVTSDAEEDSISGGTAVIAKADGPAAPVGLDSVSPTIPGAADGRITGVSALMEYSTGTGFTSPTDCYGTEITGLKTDIYYVRVKETVTHKAGAYTDVTVVNDWTAGGVDLSDWINGDVTITPGGEYTKISADNSTWNDSITISEEGENNVTIYLKKGDGTTKAGQDITVKIDKTAPAGEISIDENKWTTLLNNLTFRLFFKETKAVTITGTDAGSGVKTVEYFKTDKQVTDFSGVSWTAGSSFNITPNEKVVVYARITDNTGKQTVINSDGIVMYSDSAISASTTEFNADKQADINVTMTLNGNTLKAVKNGETVLTKGSDYTVSGNVVTIKKEYLSTALTGDSLSLTFEFNPMGVETDKVVKNTLEVTKHVHTANTDDGDCTTAITCSGCDYVMTAAKTHVLSVWQSDGTNHWKECTNSGCNHKEQSAAHTPETDDGDCTTAINCSACGYEITAGKTGHELCAGYRSDETNHWKECENEGCTYKEQVTHHTPSEEDHNCATAVTCTGCGRILTAAKSHELSDWKSDGTNHWKECANSGCNHKEQTAEHTPGDAATVYAPQLCTECGYEIAAKLPSKDVLIDSSTGAKVKYEDGLLFEEDMNLSVVLQPESEVNDLRDKVDKIAKDCDISALYEITILQLGDSVPLGGNVKVSIPLTASMKAMTDLQIIYVDDSGEITIIPSQVIEGNIVFVTDHFSSYGVIGKEKPTDNGSGSTAGNDNSGGADKGKPATGDSNNIGLYLILAIIAGSGAVAVTSNRRRKSK